MRARLLREGFPRVQMFILVALTGLAGFAAPTAMLAAGPDAMALRYALAMGAAYLGPCTRSQVAGEALSSR